MNPAPIRLSQIRALLKQHPRGLSIQDLAKMTGINRNSASKYLEILHSSGAVDLRRLGNIKIFFLCERVPITSLLRFTHGAVVVVNADLVVHRVNPTCTALLALGDTRLSGLSLANPALGPFSEPPVTVIAKNAVRGIEGGESITMIYRMTRVEIRISAIPILLDDGRPGAALVVDEKSPPAAAERERLQGAIFHDLPEPICCFRLDGLLLWANRAFNEAVGLHGAAAMNVCNPLIGPQDSTLLASLRCTLTPDQPTYIVEGSECPGDFSSSLQWRVYGLFDDTGRLKEMVAVGHPQSAVPECRGTVAPSLTRTLIGLLG